LFLPLALWFLKNSEWPGHLVLWFLPILFFEHFNQEMSRLLVALSEQIAASLILFVRQGSWAVVLVVLMNVSESTRNLDMVMALWTTAGALSAGLAIWKLKRLNIGGWFLPVDWKWIKKGIAVSFAFLIATLALRGMQTLDRYWLQALGGIEVVGAYVLMLGVAGTLLSFLDAGIFAYAYPSLINNHHNNEQVEARAKVRQVILQTLLISVAFGIISWIMLPYLLAWIDKPLYLKSINFYPWLLMAMIFNALSMVPHIALYAQGYDKPIIYSHIVTLLAFIVATWLLSDKFQALSVPIGLSFAFLITFIFKTMAYWQVCKAQNTQKSPIQII
jgi:O-antigen/teichoic acid export membrane protein